MKSNEIVTQDENGLIYIKYSENKIKKSIETSDELFTIDIDSDNNIIGIEIKSFDRFQKLMNNNKEKSL